MLGPSITIPDCHLCDDGKGEGFYIAARTVKTASIVSNDEPPDEGPDKENEDV